VYFRIVLRSVCNLSVQFGFKKKLGIGHALLTLRYAVDYYVTNGSTVNVALLDINKALDIVCFDFY